jgi:hypothetical protein
VSVAVPGYDAGVPAAPASLPRPPFGLAFLQICQDTPSRTRLGHASIRSFVPSALAAQPGLAGDRQVAKCTEVRPR